MSNILQSGTRSLSAPMLFSALPDDMQNMLREGAHPRSVASGQIIQQRGDSAGGFYLIESGSVAVGQYLPDGEFRAVAMLGPGDSWGELALFANRPRIVDAVARSSAKVLHIRKDQFEAVLAENPAVMRDLLGALSAQLQEMLTITSGMRSGTAKARLAGMLVTFAGEQPLPARISISQQELGELLGLSRATVNAALRGYEREGMLRRSYGVIEVLDADLLRMAALGPD